MIRCHEGRPVVLRAVDQPGRKPGENLSVGQFDRFGAKRPHHVGHQRRLLHAQPQPPEVGDGADRPDAVVDRARAGIVEGEADKSVGLEAVEDFAADRAVQHLVQVRGGAKQERHRQHVHRRHEIPDQRHIGTVEVDGADAGLLDGLPFLAELARVKYPDLQPSAAVLRDQARHVAQRLDRRIVLGLGIGGAEFARGRARRGRRQKQRNDEGSRSAKDGRGCTQSLSPYDGVGAGAKRFNGFRRDARAPRAASIVRCDRVPRRLKATAAGLRRLEL